MKKIASFIVDKRNFFLGLMLAITVASVFSLFHVKVNGDMTKYLPDDSSMKIGLDIMSTSFPDAGINATFKVMFDDLSEEQKKEVETKLKAIEAVDTVSFLINSPEYNKDNHTLYVMQTHYKYGTREEKSIEKALKNDFNEYSMIWSNDNTGMIDIPKWIFIAAVAVLLAILLTTSGSWTEPFLFLVVIGCAILINMGTNIFLGSVSDITYSISAILQLVLSMDYSIILMNRYRQEKKNFKDKTIAMKAALAHAFSSVTSSAMTTVIGLLMLVFMRFKIGFDLGIVLAKGVFLSMICVLLMLPSIILFADKLITLTSKSSLRLTMNRTSRISYKYRWVIVGIFAVLCGGSYFLQKKTTISYIFTKKDRILETFPAKNTTVLLYRTQDEEAINKLVDNLYKDTNVKSMMSEYATFNKEYTAEQLSANLSALSDQLQLSPDLIGLLYYLYYGGSAINTMTASEMLSFISDNLLTEPMIASFVDPQMLTMGKTTKALANKENLTEPKTIAEIADLFGIDKQSIGSLFAMYYASKGGVESGSLTVKEFSDFVTDTIANDPQFNSIFDEETKAQLAQLKTFSDEQKMTKEVSGGEIASMMGIEKDLGSMMLVCYKALSGTYEPTPMTFPQFAEFLQKEILSKPQFTAYLDEKTKEQVSKLELFGSKEKLTQQHTHEEIASLIGYEEKQAKQIFRLSGSKTMSVEQLIKYILSSNLIGNYLTEEDRAGLVTANNMIDATLNENPMSPQDMAKLLTMDDAYTKILFTMKDSKHKGNSWKVSMQKLITTLADNKNSLSSMIDSKNLALLDTGKAIINGAVSKKSFTSDQMAKMTGMTATEAKQLFLLNQVYSKKELDWKLSIKNFIDFLVSNVLTNKTYSQQITPDMAKLLGSVQKLVNAVLSEKSYTTQEMTAIMSGLSDKLNNNTMQILYLYYASIQNKHSDWTLSVDKMFEYITKDMINQPRFNAVIDLETKKMLLDAKTQMEDGKKMLKNDDYSRLIINSNYPDESKETTAFLKNIEDFCLENCEGDFHLIGNSAMGFEMQRTFKKELRMITLLTIAAIFIIVCITFRSFTIPAILVLMVQCGVYLTISAIGFIYGDILYLALLIVECILMGATIDYGILLTNYYIESRRTQSVQEAVKEAYLGSYHTILTSGLILILVTAIVGNFFGDPTVAAIIRTISLGALSAVVLIAFILPGVLAAFDKIIIKKNKKK